MTDTIRGAPWDGRQPATGRGRQVAFAIGGVVALLAVVAAVAISSLNASIDRVDVDGLGTAPPTGTGGGTDEGDDDNGHGDGDGSGGTTQEVELDPHALTVLVLGSDSREVLTPEERVELGTGYAEGERTEVISLVRLDPDDGEVRMLSIPRDTLMTRCDGTSGRVNAAYTIGEGNGRGGATCVVQTLRDWLGVRIDHVVKVDFRGFVDIVDALGGVSMYLDEPLQDDNANLDLEAGCVRLDGADSLAFVRARHIDNDFGRMGRQQRFVSELRNELASVGVLDDPARTYRVAEAVARAVELDDSLTLNRIQQLVREHRATLQGGIDGRVLTGSIEYINEAAYVIVDDARARELLRWLITGDDPAEQRGGSRDADQESEAQHPDIEAAEEDVAAASGRRQGGPVGQSPDGPRAPIDRSETCR
ncbi:LCP family protein [Egicoccus sp. AB-alg6-2]|uniref:LCP family protein n=1 Tax=Egicoccus sp. AB-alg6-2 TaxID=3242692 RepID=UPI00359D169D